MTNDEIKKINELYLEKKTYAAVARELGYSPATVKRYVVPGYKPQSQLVIKRFNGDIPDFNPQYFVKENWASLCNLTDREKNGMKELWEELEL